VTARAAAPGGVLTLEEGVTHLVVATVNIQHGLPAADPGPGGAPAAGTGALLERAFAGVSPDILAVEEVDVGQPRSGRVDQAAILARATGLAHYRFAAAIEGDVRAGRTRGRRTTASPGYGIVLLSRYPVVAWFAQPLPGASRAPVPDEPRVALAAVVRLPEGLACVAATHLSRGPVARLQLDYLRRRVDGLARRASPVRGTRLPALLLGDLNLPPAAAARAGELLARVPTFPAWAPTRQPDHVIGLGGVAARGPAGAQRLAVSDHCLLTVPVAVGHAPRRL
jgi:endonuclease/exonuclease/phosphatase family metal-dependent hydrolase